jgi:hypothetical protein
MAFGLGLAGLMGGVQGLGLGMSDIADQRFKQQQFDIERARLAEQSRIADAQLAMEQRKQAWAEQANAPLSAEEANQVMSYLYPGRGGGAVSVGGAPAGVTPRDVAVREEIGGPGPFQFSMPAVRPPAPDPGVDMPGGINPAVLTKLPRQVVVPILQEAVKQRMLDQADAIKQRNAMRDRAVLASTFDIPGPNQLAYNLIPGEDEEAAAFIPRVPGPPTPENAAAARMALSGQPLKDILAWQEAQRTKAFMDVIAARMSGGGPGGPSGQVTTRVGVSGDKPNVEITESPVPVNDPNTEAQALGYPSYEQAPLEVKGKILATIEQKKLAYARAQQTSQIDVNLDKPYSPAEAGELNVPIGTTPRQASAMGITPKSSQERNRIDNMRTAAAIIDNVERSIFEGDPKTGLPPITLPKTPEDRLWNAPGTAMDMWLQRDPGLVALNGRIKASMAPMIRALGEVGTLTDQDIARANALWPTIGPVPDTEPVVRAKLSGLRDLVNEIADRTRGGGAPREGGQAPSSSSERPADAWWRSSNPAVDDLLANTPGAGLPLPAKSGAVVRGKPQNETKPPQPLSRTNPNYKSAKQHGWSDENIEKYYNVRIVD